MRFGYPNDHKAAQAGAAVQNAFRACEDDCTVILRCRPGVSYRYKKSGHGDSVLLITGQHVRHYALTVPKEFFAEMSEAYFGMNDFFPFNRAELKINEPEIYDLLRTVWGPIAQGR